jgi:ABC-type dipeptide/oligopeptide/nickel transport system ATPase component
VVLLDEATSALDTATEQSVQNALEALGRKRTVLVIAHRLSTVMNCDQIIVLDGGRVAEKGAHHELLALRGIYHTLWAMQLRSRDDNEAGGRSGSVSRAGSKDNFLESAVSEAAAAAASASDVVFRAPKQAQGTPPLDIFTMAGTTAAASAAPPAVPAPASAHASS